MKLAGGTIGFWLLTVGLICVWGAMATVAVLGARVLGLPERPPLILVSVLFFVLLWGIPIAIAYRMFSDGEGPAGDSESERP